MLDHTIFVSDVSWSITSFATIDKQ